MATLIDPGIASTLEIYLGLLRYNILAIQVQSLGRVEGPSLAQDLEDGHTRYLTTRIYLCARLFKKSLRIS